MFTTGNTGGLRFSRRLAARGQVFLTRLIVMALLFCAVLFSLPAQAQKDITPEGFTPKDSWQKQPLVEDNTVTLYVVPNVPSVSNDTLHVLSIKPADDNKDALFLLDRTKDTWNFQTKDGPKEVPGLKQVQVKMTKGVTTLTFITDNSSVLSEPIPDAVRVRYDPKVFTLNAPTPPSSVPPPPDKRGQTLIGAVLAGVVTLGSVLAVLAWFKHRKQPDHDSEGTGSNGTGYQDIDRRLTELNGKFTELSKLVTPDKWKALGLDDAAALKAMATGLKSKGNNTDAASPESAPTLTEILADLCRLTKETKEDTVKVQSVLGINNTPQGADVTVQPFPTNGTASADTLISVVNRLSTLMMPPEGSKPLTSEGLYNHIMSIREQLEGVRGLQSPDEIKTLAQENTEGFLFRMKELENSLKTMENRPVSSMGIGEVTTAQAEALRIIAQAKVEAARELQESINREKVAFSTAVTGFNTNVTAAKGELDNKRNFAITTIDKKKDDHVKELEAKQRGIDALMEEIKKYASDDAYTSKAQEHLDAFLEALSKHLEEAKAAAQMALDAKAIAIERKIDDKQKIAEESAATALNLAKDKAVADAKEEMEAASKPFVQEVSGIKTEIDQFVAVRRDELIKTLEKKESLIVEALQTLVKEAQLASTTAQNEAQNISTLLSDIGRVRKDADNAVERMKETIATVEQAAERSEAAHIQISDQVDEIKAQLDRVDRLDNIMMALQGAIRQIQTATSTSPSAAPVQSSTAGMTDSEASPMPMADLHAAVTKGKPEFDYLALFSRVVNTYWPEILTAARNNDGSYFTPRRMDDLDKALYGDATQLLGAQPEYQNWVADLAEELKVAQQQRIAELAEAGMSRIEGQPGAAERPRWLEANPEDSVPTTDSTLAGTFADIEPGKGGYKLHTKALRPSVARFYRLAQS